MPNNKPFNGLQSEKYGRTLELSGETGWQKYEALGDVIVSSISVTLKSDREWLESDKAQWFVAFPTVWDNKDGQRDYVIIKNRYDLVAEEQKIEYFQQKDPLFEAVKGDFVFTDEGEMYSDQIASKNFDSAQQTTNALEA